MGSLALTTACSGYVAGRVEQLLLDAMPQAVGPAERYEATVDGASADGSHFDTVRVAGVRVQRARAPAIDRFDLVMHDVSVDRPNKRLTRIGAARATMTVRAADLVSFLERQSWIAQPRVQLIAPDGVVVSGFFKVPGLGVAAASPASLRGRLVADGTRLLVAVDSLSLGNNQAPALLKDVVASAINPLFDLSTYAVPSTIDRVSVAEDAVRFEASGTQVNVTQRR